VHPSRWAASASLLAAAALGIPLIVTSTAAAGIPATLVAEYSFDAVDVANTSTVADLTGRGHLLTLSGAWSATDGVSSPAVAFAPISMGNSPHLDDLNPRSREFAVTAVFRVPGDTSALRDTPNIVQKGFFGDAGQWKMQLKPKPGTIQCRFKGTLGAKLLTSPVPVDDAAWHTATCARSGSLLSVMVDGVATELTYNVGDISNRRPLRVGAKSLTATTDQFTGSLDYVAVAMGDGAEALSRVSAPADATPAP
jgi:hypothetical protein